MKNFIDIPVIQSGSGESSRWLRTFDTLKSSTASIASAIEENLLVLIRRTSFQDAGILFQELVDKYGIRASFELQMRFIAQLLNYRVPVGGVAVTVNERGPLQIIQAHSEGDTTTQLDLFGLYCEQNARIGGHNILSLINQSADHSKLRAREKAIVGVRLSTREIVELRKNHLDARAVVDSRPPNSRVISDSGRGKVVVRPVPIVPMKSGINGESLVTYWDNVSVHDHAFHRHQYELLKYLGILNSGVGKSYLDYMHIEKDSYWGPADTDSGGVKETAGLFSCHLLHKMDAGDLLLFHNRAWTHSVNNWPPEETRKLVAMYA